jgi:biopolymer transport protein ExbD
MPLKTTASEELPSVNLTPMIDVVFLLIIFFMVGTQFSDSEREIDLSLPGAGQLNAMMSAPEKRKVSVTANGSVTLDGRSVDLATLTAELQRMRQSYPGLGVVVRADGSVEHQTVTDVYGAIDRAGVEAMSIAVRYQPTSQPPNYR